MKLKELKDGEIFTSDETNRWKWVKLNNNDDTHEYPNCCTCRRLESNVTRLNESLLAFKRRPIINQFDKNMDVNIK